MVDSLGFFEVIMYAAFFLNTHFFIPCLHKNYIPHALVVFHALLTCLSTVLGVMTFADHRRTISATTA